MKRDRDYGAMEAMGTANCLMLLSRVGETEAKRSSRERLYRCKTCDREFPTFQALGGHRASHKKPRLEMPELALHGLEMSGFVIKHKTHECSICGLEFPIGQALGGHMRRHRAEMAAGKLETTPQPFPVLMKKSTSKRVLCLDLNLSPFENDLSLQLGKIASCTVDLAI